MFSSPLFLEQQHNWSLWDGSIPFNGIRPQTRFEYILKAISITDEPPPEYKETFGGVGQLVDAWNYNTENIFHPDISLVWMSQRWSGLTNMLESVGIFYRQDYLDWVDLQMDSNNIYYFEFQICNLDLQQVYNRCKLTIQRLWCSNSRPYKTLSWISYTTKSSQYTNYISRKNLHLVTSKYTCPGFVFVLQKLWTFRNEWHIISCSDSGILFCAALVEVKDTPAERPPHKILLKSIK